MTFHVLALAPAAIGLCCLAADRRRARVAELGAGLLMLLAMLDAAVTSLVPVVWWVVALVAGAMALAAVYGRSRGPVAAGVTPGARTGSGTPMTSGAGMTVHAASGMVVMAALLLSMAGAGGAGVGAHHHGGPTLAAAGLVLGGAYLVASVALGVRSSAPLARAQYLAMGASVALMSLALV